ncbi:S8 family serine peptidase [Arthrobacter sp. zg-Y820]|uniref:S8 family serine peptidase n=1 Tax=unclassified Arthrobacter TaxID=235627 RepID=UPI001E4B9679|nr:MULTISPECIES: S8 family serine peptidase [unclassified Arthrobacter]MCC9198301.1 S8 family serine peptidase [Arthrobacter sp. zg-Y820]MDK1281171.1 S8 family serine peptidase [Arthrobacter sp. zg.Y820]WIB09764.1 S8 family serine peptidase [Arthrobacter sp. zg-Y820]
MNNPNHRRSGKAALATLAGLALVSSMWTPASAVEGNPQGDPTAQGLARATPDLKVSADLKKKQGPVSVFVQFTGKGAFEQTQPQEVRDGLAAPQNRAPQVQEIRSAIEAQAAEVAAQASSSIIYTTTNTVPGVAINGDAEAIRALAARGDVAKITGIVPKTHENKGGDIDVRALDSWTQRDQTGEGVTIAVLDTGVDYTHADFGGPGTLEAFAQAQASDEMPAADSGLYDPEKFAGGWDLVGDAYNADSTAGELYNPIPKPDANPLDCQSHGSHVAGTAAGYGTNADGTTFTGDYSALTADDVNKMGIGPGTAPEAKIVSVRVFGCDGSSEVVGQALDYVLDPNGDGDFSDRAQVVNMSLGSSFPAYDDPENDIVNALTAQGILSVVSSGNSGDIYDIGGSPGSAETALTVANSVGSQTTLDAANVLAPTAGEASGQYTASFNYAAAPAEALTGTVVMGPDGDNSDGCAPLDAAADNAGKWVWLSWDDSASRECGSLVRWDNAAKAGYAGVVVDSTLNGFDAGVGGNALIPGIQLTANSSKELRTAAEAGTLEIQLATDLVGAVTGESGALDTLNPSSSRGVHGSNGVIKPDVAAPGTQIKSAQVGTGTGASIKSGTSMAAPNVAGIAALVIAETDLNPYEVKSIIMNTATHDLLTADGVVYGPNRVGSGRVDALDALETQVLAYDSENPRLTSVNFGVLELGTQPIELTRSVTVENKGDSQQIFTAEYLAATKVPGVTITTATGPISVPANGKATVPVTLSIADPAALAKTIDPAAEKTQGQNNVRQYIAEASGRLQLTSDAATLRVPVYSAPKPTSNMKASSKITFADESALSALTTFSGRALNQGEGTEAYVSAVTPLVLGAESERASDLPLDSLYSLDLRTVGASSNVPALAAAKGDSAAAVFNVGVSTWENWASLNANSQISVEIDTNNDGATDFLAATTSASGVDQSVFVMYPVVNGTLGNSLGVLPVNGTDGSIDTNNFDTNVVTLPIPAAALGLDLTKSAPIQYLVSTHNNFNVDETGQTVPVDSTEWIGFNVTQPAMWFQGAAGTENATTFIEADAATLAVNRQATTTGGKALFLHHHNAEGVKDQVAKVELGPLRFPDVPGTMFEADINWMADEDLTTGYDDGTYRPAGSINRDAMAAFLYRLAGSPAYDAPDVSAFTDIAPDNQFYKEISWLASTGISKGYPDGTFRPLAPVKRDAMAAFMNRFAGEQCSVEDALGYTAPGAASFTDVPTADQFHREISWMKDSGVSTGYPDSSFHPLEDVSREAMAAFIHRLDTYNNDNGGCNSF